ncbi:hypothetical protein D3C85_1125420 [compost metagenome]
MLSPSGVRLINGVSSHPFSSAWAVNGPLTTEFDRMKNDLLPISARGACSTLPEATSGMDIATIERYVLASRGAA